MHEHGRRPYRKPTLRRRRRLAETAEGTVSNIIVTGRTNL